METPSRSDFMFRLSRSNMLPGPFQSFLNSQDSVNKNIIKQLEKATRGIESLNKELHEIRQENRVMRGQLDALLASRASTAPAQVTNNFERSEHSISLQSVPSEYSISEEELASIKRDSKGAGNFGAQLVKRLFPELFGPTNLRHQYNWFGGGVKSKQELCPERKSVVKQYVTFYYPELVDAEQWRDRVVPKINELLRRKDKLPSALNCDQPQRSQIPLPELTPTTYRSLLDYYGGAQI
ncbi:BEN domain-containing protein 3-like [Mercenaria mercenaria]|uniref:BEN domain-containing protein 3-like n=1 Tax=Mercenaria mercenaria TaxID=6596 RepID=UPI00234F561C|nr:BEN domain-containing protein 3-like [Mercenaria mercenaria]